MFPLCPPECNVAPLPLVGVCTPARLHGILRTTLEACTTGKSSVPHQPRMNFLFYDSEQVIASPGVLSPSRRSVVSLPSSSGGSVCPSPAPFSSGASPFPFSRLGTASASAPASSPGGEAPLSLSGSASPVPADDGVFLAPRPGAPPSPDGAAGAPASAAGPSSHGVASASSSPDAGGGRGEEGSETVGAAPPLLPSKEATLTALRRAPPVKKKTPPAPEQLLNKGFLRHGWMRKQLAERPAAYALCFDWREAFDPAAAPALASPVSHQVAHSNSHQVEAPSHPSSTDGACGEPSTSASPAKPCCPCCPYTRELLADSRAGCSGVSADSFFSQGGTQRSSALGVSEGGGEDPQNACPPSAHAGPAAETEATDASRDMCLPGSPHCCRNINAAIGICSAHAALQDRPGSEDLTRRSGARGSEHGVQGAAFPKSPQGLSGTEATEALFPEPELDAREIAIARAERAALALIERIRDHVHRKKVAPKMILFVILPSGLPDPQSAVSCLRRLNPSEIAALFVTCGIDDIQTKMDRLEQVAYDCAVEHYENESRRYRKQIHHAPKGADRNQSNACHVYHVRSLVKAGYMLEFAAQPHGAMKSFIAAWQLLTTDKQMASAVERMSLCNLLSVRMYHMYFQANEPAKAAHHAREHRVVLRENPEEEELFGYLLPQWLAELHELLAHLQQEALLAQHRLSLQVTQTTPRGRSNQPTSPASPQSSLHSSSPHSHSMGRRPNSEAEVSSDLKRQTLASALGFGRHTGRDSEGGLNFLGNGLHFNKWGLSRDSTSRAAPLSAGPRRDQAAAPGESSLAFPPPVGPDEPCEPLQGACSPTEGPTALLPGLDDSQVSLSQMVAPVAREEHVALTSWDPGLLSLTTEAWENPGFHFEAAARYLQELRVWVRRAKVQVRPPSMKGGLAVPSEWIGQLDTLQHGVEAFSLVPHSSPGAAAALMRQEVILRWIFSVNEQQVAMHATRLLSKAHAIYKCIGGSRGCPVIACQLADALFDSQRMLTARQLYATLAHALSANLFSGASLLSSSFCPSTAVVVGGGSGNRGNNQDRQARDRGDEKKDSSTYAHRETARPLRQQGDCDGWGQRDRDALKEGEGGESEAEEEEMEQAMRTAWPAGSEEVWKAAAEFVEGSATDHQLWTMKNAGWWPLLVYVLARLLLSICSLLSLAPPPFLYDLAHVNPLFHCIEARHAPSSLSQSVDSVPTRSVSPQDDVSSKSNSAIPLSSLNASAGGPDKASLASPSVAGPAPRPAWEGEGRDRRLPVDRVGVSGPTQKGSGTVDSESHASFGLDEAFAGNEDLRTFPRGAGGSLENGDEPASGRNGVDRTEETSEKPSICGPPRLAHAEADERLSGDAQCSGRSLTSLQALASLPSFLDFENYRIGVLSVFELMNLFALRAARDDPQGERRRQLRAFLLLALLPKLQHLVESREEPRSSEIRDGVGPNGGHPCVAPSDRTREGSKERIVEIHEDFRGGESARSERCTLTVSLPGVVGWLALPSADAPHREAVALWRAGEGKQKVLRASGEREATARSGLPGEEAGKAERHEHKKKRRPLVQGLLCVIQRFGLDLEVTSRGVLVTSRGPLPCRLLPLVPEEETEEAWQQNLSLQQGEGADAGAHRHSPGGARDKLRSWGSPPASVSLDESVRHPSAAERRPGVVIPSGGLCCFRLVVYPCDARSASFSSSAVSAPLRVLGLSFSWQLCRLVTFALSTVLPLDAACPPPNLEPWQMKQVRLLLRELERRGEREEASSAQPQALLTPAINADSAGQNELYEDVCLQGPADERKEGTETPLSSSASSLLDSLAHFPRGCWPEPVRRALLQKRLSVPPPPMPPFSTGEQAAQNSPFLFLPGKKLLEDFRPDRFFRVSLCNPACAWKDEVVPLLLRIAVQKPQALPSHLRRCRLVLFASHEAVVTELVSSGEPQALNGGGSAETRCEDKTSFRGLPSSAFLETTGSREAPGLTRSLSTDASKRESFTDTHGMPWTEGRDERGGEEGQARRDDLHERFLSVEHKARLHSREGERMFSLGWPERPNSSFESLGGLAGRRESLVDFAAFLEERGGAGGGQKQRPEEGARSPKFRMIFPVSVPANRPVLSLDFDGLQREEDPETHAKMGTSAGGDGRAPDGGSRQFRLHREPERGGTTSSSSSQASPASLPAFSPDARVSASAESQTGGCLNCLGRLADWYRSLGYFCRQAREGQGLGGETLVLTRAPTKFLSRPRADEGHSGGSRGQGFATGTEAAAFLFESDVRQLTNSRDPSDPSRSSVRLFTFRPSNRKAQSRDQAPQGERRRKNCRGRYEEERGENGERGEAEERNGQKEQMGQEEKGDEQGKEGHEDLFGEKSRSECSPRRSRGYEVSEKRDNADDRTVESEGLSAVAFDGSFRDPKQATSGGGLEAKHRAEDSLYSSLNARQKQKGEGPTPGATAMLSGEEEIAVPLLFKAKTPGAVQIRVLLEFPSRPRLQNGGSGDDEKWREEDFLDVDHQEDFVTAAGSILVQKPLEVQLQPAPFASTAGGEEQSSSKADPRSCLSPPANREARFASGVAPLAYLHVANPSSIALRLDDVAIVPLSVWRPEKTGETEALAGRGHESRGGQQTQGNTVNITAADATGGGTEAECEEGCASVAQKITQSRNRAKCKWSICSECGALLPSGVALEKTDGDGDERGGEKKGILETEALAPPLIGSLATVESLEAWSAVVDLEALLRRRVSPETMALKGDAGDRHPADAEALTPASLQAASCGDPAVATEYAVHIRFQRHADALPYPFNVFSSLFEPREQLFPFSLPALLPACVDLAPVAIRVTHTSTPTVGVPFTLRATITNNTARPQETTVKLVYPPVTASVDGRFQAEGDLGGEGSSELSARWSGRSECPYLISGVMCTDLLLSPESDRVIQWTMVACRAGAFSVPTVMVRCHRYLSGEAATQVTTCEEETTENAVAQELTRALREAIEGSPQAPDSLRGGSVFMSHLTNVVVFPNSQ
ncbi:hypothetical protein TGFOU_264090 [Toxoplasma gondii FOU]|uniref:Uncharacterized protein n=2 Tax=Toxoplasma gondii TaxID=5811 RepID=A0A086L6M6_TOXGO|nr:hypothetical protein TGFOU_264090 [Toxoplasma gondii FOU]PUA89983.1 hypothetical protein TGBR9_264090 [Toxoplasma gondii TgCATBr9]